MTTKPSAGQDDVIIENYNEEEEDSLIGQAPDVEGNIRMTERSFKLKKERILAKIIPISLIPMSTANVMLVMGAGESRRIDGHSMCFVDLPSILLIIGIVSTGLVLMGVVSESIVEWIVETRIITRTERYIITFLRRLGSFLAVVEVCLLITMTIADLQLAGGWQSEDVLKPHYCQYGVVIFSVVLLCVTWTFVLYAAGAYIYIHYLVPEPKRIPSVPKKP